MSTDEAIRALFQKKVIDRIRKEIGADEKQARKPAKKKKKSEKK